MRKIEGAMKRPEFQELLGDYMKEISDPKNREVSVEIYYQGIRLISAAVRNGI